MIPAKVSGIMYSRDPDSPKADATLIRTVWGLGAYAVGGVVPTQDYRVSGEKIEFPSACTQEEMLVGRPEGGTEPVPLNRESAR